MTPVVNVKVTPIGCERPVLSETCSVHVPPVVPAVTVKVAPPAGPDDGETLAMLLQPLESIVNVPLPGDSLAVTVAVCPLLVNESDDGETFNAPGVAVGVGAGVGETTGPGA